MDTLAAGTPAPSQVTLAPLPASTAALIGVAAFIVVMIPFLWPFGRHFGLIAHEGAHALAALLLGFAIETVILGTETGVTKYQAVRGAIFRVVTVGIVGYLGPSLFGLAAAKLIETGRVLAVLWLAILLLVLLFFLLGPSLGIISVPFAIYLLVLITRGGHAWIEQLVIYGLAWVLLLDGLRVAIAHGTDAVDAGILHGQTHVHPRVWSLLWIAGALLAVIIGGKWLILRS